MREACVLGVDVGTTNLKLLALSREGAVVARATSGCQVRASADGWVTQDAREWMTALDICFASIGSQCSLKTVKALGLSAQGETLVCCDAQNNPLAPAISWMDTRAVVEARELLAERGDWHTLTGKPVAAYSSLSKIRWIQKHQPGLFGSIARFCQVADFMVAQFTGEWLLDANNASFTSCFNLRQRNWDSELTGRYGLSGKLPEVRESGTVAGKLRPKLSERWGLEQEPCVVLGGHDQGCAAVGAGLPDKSVLLSTGTAWVLYACMPEPRLAPQSRGAITYCHARPNAWAALAAFSGGGALDAFAARFLGKNDLASAYAAIESQPNLAGDLLVLPYFFGANAPANDPMARAAILNLGPAHGPEHIFHAILESIAFETRRNLATFLEMQVDCGQLIMTGGATRSAVWPQIVADVCGIPVHVSVEQDAAALGAAILAGESERLWKEGFAVAGGKELVIQPGEEGKLRLDRKYQQYPGRYRHGSNATQPGFGKVMR